MTEARETGVDIRLEHKTLGDGRYHVITSPDVKGLHVTSETEAGALQEAIAAIGLLSDQHLLPPLGSVKAIQFEAA